mgnify:CR=1 FL=1
MHKKRQSRIKIFNDEFSVVFSSSVFRVCGCGCSYGDDDDDVNDDGEIFFCCSFLLKKFICRRFLFFRNHLGTSAQQSANLPHHNIFFSFAISIIYGWGTLFSVISYIRQ